MKKKKKNSNIAVIAVVIVLIAILIIIKNSHNPVTTEEIAKCIGQNSVLYTQLGCAHCQDQEEMFGENIQYLEVIDCFYERDKCGEIQGTPTWKIKNKYYEGVKSIEKLQELTGCE